MTYELIKQLKDAGFPKQFFEVCDATCPLRHYEHFYNPPTLEELIAACELKFKSLNRRAEFWRADSHRYRIAGKTPNEAVGKLWLALNKHEH